MNYLGPAGYAVEASDINALSSRHAMGLPETYTPGQFDELAQQCKDIVNLDSSELEKLLSDLSAALPLRLAAGELLSLIGDPRIICREPQMIEVPPSLVKIGSATTDIDRVCLAHPELFLKPAWLSKETPSFEVVLDAYAIAKFPVTNMEYRDFLLANPTEEIPSSWPFGIFPRERSNHAVYSIKPSSAETYCKWLSSETGRRFRLPSEAEWEYAASGPERHEYPWGSEFDPTCANTLELGLFQTAPVGVFPRGRSYFGVMDLAGSVEEYCADNYAPYPGGEIVEDDLYKTIGPHYRIARGGSFARFRDMARCRRRHGGPIDRDIYVMGFRLAETLE